jgi:hypothetical protein
MLAAALGTRSPPISPRALASGTSRAAGGAVTTHRLADGLSASHNPRPGPISYGWHHHRS